MRTAERRPTAFGRIVSAHRRQLRLSPDRFAELCGVSLSAMKQWEYGWRSVSSKRAAKLARRLGLPAWHFEQALAQDRLASYCRVNEVTAVVVGFVEYVERRLPGAEFAAVRARLMEG
jgi:transcriptional regulator with XRE-family HTH domain